MKWYHDSSKSYTETYSFSLILVKETYSNLLSRLIPILFSSRRNLFVPVPPFLPFPTPSEFCFAKINQERTGWHAREVSKSNVTGLITLPFLCILREMGLMLKNYAEKEQKKNDLLIIG